MLLACSQIICEKPKQVTGITELSQTFKELGVNYKLPVAYLTEKKGVYEIVEGHEVYPAAVKAGLKEIWVFVLAKQHESSTRKNMKLVTTRMPTFYLKFTSANKPGDYDQSPGARFMQIMNSRSCET